MFGGGDEKLLHIGSAQKAFVFGWLGAYVLKPIGSQVNWSSPFRNSADGYYYGVLLYSFFQAGKASGQGALACAVTVYHFREGLSGGSSWVNVAGLWT